MPPGSLTEQKAWPILAALSFPTVCQKDIWADDRTPERHQGGEDAKLHGSGQDTRFILEKV